MLRDKLTPPLRAAGQVLTLVVSDIGRGMLVVSHNTLALLGLLLVTLAAVFSTQPTLLTTVEHHALSWLAARDEARREGSADFVAEAEPGAVQRVMALEPTQLPRPQAQVASWLARRYKVAPEAVARIVDEAWKLGERARIDPTLILAVAAIESSFNPLAQSPVGAQGLMQVMTRVHDDKYLPYGGERAALDPLTNLRVGVQVLRECIQRAGSVNDGLRWYVGAANLDDDGGYAARVLFEQEQIRAVAAGRAPSLRSAPLRDAPSVQPPEPAASLEQVAYVDREKP